MTSTINRGLPDTGKNIFSKELRDQFGAAADDIEALQVNQQSSEPGKRSVAVLGDEMVVRCKPTVSSIDYQFYPDGFWWWTDLLSKGRLDLVPGTSGYDGLVGEPNDTTTDMLARMTTGVVPLAPGYLVVASLGNDLLTLTSTQSIANYEAILAEALKNNIIVVLCTWCSNHVNTVARGNHQNAVNAWMRGLKRNGVYVADVAELVVDPALAYPTPKASYIATGPQLNTLGSFAYAVRVANVITSRVPSRGFFHDPAFTGATGPEGVVANTHMSGSGGTLVVPDATGTMPDAWALEGASSVQVVASVSARSMGDDVQGNMVSLVHTGGANLGPQVSRSLMRFTAPVGLPSGLVAGDLVSLAVEVANSDAPFPYVGRFTPCEVNIRFVGATLEHVRYLHATTSPEHAQDVGTIDTALFDASIVYPVRTPFIPIPLSTTAIDCIIKCPGLADSPQFTTNIGRVSLVTYVP